MRGLRLHLHRRPNKVETAYCLGWSDGVRACAVQRAQECAACYEAGRRDGLLVGLHRAGLVTEGVRLTRES